MRSVERFVERKARKSRSLLRSVPLWGNSPVLSPVRWKGAPRGALLRGALRGREPGARLRRACSPTRPFP
ncbi:hypothetical protein E6R60_06895 [Streptomyces sp. A0642]|nr:hypothetical protein E6R60_06895 [Streptomyces sp. A0642]